MLRLLKLFASLLLLSSFTANAIPLSYDEGVDGDIAFSTLSLDIGVNTVAGTISCPSGGAGCDFDKFDALLPTNGLLESIELNLLDGAGGNGLFAKWFEVYGPDNALLINAATSAGGLFFWAIGESFSDLNFVGSNNLPAGFVNDYLITFNIASVPEPSIIWLLGSGLALIGFARRKA